MPKITGQLTDFGFAPLAGHDPRLVFRHVTPGLAGAAIMTTKPVYAKPFANGYWEAELVASARIAPAGFYTVDIEWTEPPSKKRYSERFPGRLYIPAEGGVLSDILRVPANPALVWEGTEPPANPSPGTWWLDDEGRLNEHNGTGWNFKQNLRGPAGYNATGAAANQQTIADYILGTAGKNPVSEALDATVGREVSTARAASVIVQGAKADYTGYLNAGTGTGTDDRAAIQRALNAAVTTNSPDFWGYLSRRSVTVKLPAGTYLIGARPDGMPSLQVPAGVTFDTSDATLFFDYPTNATTSWAGIMVHTFGNLIVGKLRPSRRNPAPDANPFYDGVRLFGNINNGTKLIGYKDSEINGFQGAGVRGIAAFVVHVNGIRLANNHHSYVASNYGDGYGYTMPAGAPNRVHTEIYFTDCQFHGNRRGGFLGTVQGKAGNINTVDYDKSGVSVWFTNTSFEDNAGYAIAATNVFNFGLSNVHLEESGTSNGMVFMDTVRVVEIENVMVNLAGREITGLDGAKVTPKPSQIFNVNSVQSFNVDGLYVHNSLVDGFALMKNAPRSYSTAGIMWDALPLAPGPGVTSHWGSTHLKADYIKPFVLGTTRLWVDVAGTIRTSKAAPASDTDGAPLATAPNVALAGTVYPLGENPTTRQAAFGLGEAVPSWLTLTAVGAGSAAGPVADATATTRAHLPMRTGSEAKGNNARIITPALPLAEYRAVMFEVDGLQWNPAAAGDMKASAVIGLSSDAGTPAAGAEVRHNAWDAQSCFLYGGSAAVQGKYFPHNMRTAGAAAVKRRLAVLILPAEQIVVFLENGAVVNWEKRPDMGTGLVRGRIQLITDELAAHTFRVETLRLTTWN